MKLTVLGYYGGYPYQNTGTSGYLLQANGFNLLLDCGSGVLMELEDVLDPLRLDAVLLSHYHADHVADVGVLQYYWQLHSERYQHELLPIYGHVFDQAAFDGLDWPAATEKRAYDPETVNQIEPFEIKFLRTEHPVPAFAMRIKERDTGKVLVYTADSKIFPALTKFAHDADQLIADTNFFANQPGKIWHMTTTQVGEMALKAHVHSLLISHLPQTADRNRLLQETTVASHNQLPVQLPHTGMVINI
ncbi:MBL fold metallo-hydrolase [Fructilactobacillus cliffordii]|uniref:MBL fold metallo-hydrolase n=1 Tax=Fructilactobacillus cliffordii TaxID=2940299 RepID=UPI00209292AB|nr:MBL fold metallo-hydrolase [Fructilactobacillus cliffordii]USS86374.1 MBL fold metallo-hydrolase [Fructilactobacillus cliffordii]